MSVSQPASYLKRLGTWDIFVAGVALVVAASTMVSEFVGYFQAGVFFVISLLLGFAINLSLALSAADLSVSLPKAGALYDYARAILPQGWGRRVAAFRASREAAMSFRSARCRSSCGESTRPWPGGGCPPRSKDCR